MKILFLADNFPPEKNAQASRVYERACYWVRWGHSVTVITCAPNFPEGKVYPGYRNAWYQVEDISGIRVVRIKTFIAPNAGNIKRIVDFVSYMVTAFGAGLFQSRPDLLVATSPQFFAAVAGWALSHIKRVPFIFELSDLWPDSIVAVGAMKRHLALRLLEKMELFLYRQAAAIVALTSPFKDNLVRRGISSEKISVVTNGVELSRYFPRSKNEMLARQWGVRPGDLVIAYIGTLGMAHSLDNLLNAAQLIRSDNIRFLLIGPGAEREKLQGRAKELGLSNVTFIPPQPKDEMPEFWSICDVALVHLKNAPLFSTVIPSKIFEAMGMGLPILLVAPEGEATRIVSGEEAGLCVPPANPQALADAALLFAESPSMRARFAQSSRSAASRHSRERQAKEMMSAFEMVLCNATTHLDVPEDQCTQ